MKKVFIVVTMVLAVTVVAMLLTKPEAKEHYDAVVGLTQNVVDQEAQGLEKLAEKVDLPEDKIDEAMSVNSHHISVDAPFADSEDSSLLDVLVNEDIPTTDMGLVNESLKSEIQAALSVLSERERKVIEASYGIEQPELTLEEIGEKFGLSRERVRQIKEKAIRKLRTSTKNKTLKTYLG